MLKLQHLRGHRKSLKDHTVKNILLVNALLLILFLSETAGGRLLSPPCREPIVTGSGLPGLYAPPGRDPDADQEATRRGADVGAAKGEPGVAPASVAHRACQQQCQALSHRQRPPPPVERRRPRSGDGTLLCPAQLPGALDPVAANDLIGINSIVGAVAKLLMPG